MKTVLPWSWLVPVPLCLLVDAVSGGGWPILAADVLAAAVALPALVLAQRGRALRSVHLAAAALLLALGGVAVSGLLSVTVLWLSLSALVHLARRGAGPLSICLLVALAVANTAVPGLIPGDGLTFALGASTLVVAALALGLLLRMVDRSLTERTATAAEAERRRIATDLHDLVAHEVTGIVVLAQAGSRSEDPALLRSVLTRIEDSGSRALEEIRSLVGHSAQAPSTPTAAGPEALTQRVSDFAARDEVTTETRLALSAPVPSALWPTLDRILLEALTNIRRHAGPGAHVRVTITSESDTLTLTVVNTPGSGGVGRGGGTGLSSLTTRCESLGGQLRAGPVEDTWRLEARLPLNGGRP